MMTFSYLLRFVTSRMSRCTRSFVFCRFFLVLDVGGSRPLPRASGVGSTEGSEAPGRFEKNKKGPRGKKGLKPLEYKRLMKERALKRGRDVPQDSKYSGRKRSKVQFWNCRELKKWFVLLLKDSWNSRERRSGCFWIRILFMREKLELWKVIKTFFPKKAANFLCQQRFLFKTQCLLSYL